MVTIEQARQTVAAWLTTSRDGITRGLDGRDSENSLYWEIGFDIVSDDPFEHLVGQALALVDKNTGKLRLVPQPHQAKNAPDVDWESFRSVA